MKGRKELTGTGRSGRMEAKVVDVIVRGRWLHKDRNGVVAGSAEGLCGQNDHTTTQDTPSSCACADEGESERFWSTRRS